jgi:hypothetical protein
VAVEFESDPRLAPSECNCFVTLLDRPSALARNAQRALGRSPLFVLAFRGSLVLETLAKGKEISQAATMDFGIWRGPEGLSPKGVEGLFVWAFSWIEKPVVEFRGRFTWY